MEINYKIEPDALAGVVHCIEHQFISQLGHMSGLQARSPVGSMREATTH